MFDAVRNKIRKLARAEHVTISHHAEEEMDANEISTDEVLKVLINSDIIEKQHDRVTGEWKYLLSGVSIGLQVAVVAKISINNKVFIITVYSL